MARWLREEQQLRDDADAEETDAEETDAVVAAGEESEEAAAAAAAEAEGGVATPATPSSSSSSRDAWTPVHVEPSYGPCDRCYPRPLKFHANGTTPSTISTRIFHELDLSSNAPSLDFVVFLI